MLSETKLYTNVHCATVYYDRGVFFWKAVEKWSLGGMAVNLGAFAIFDKNLFVLRGARDTKKAQIAFKIHLTKYKIGSHVSIWQCLDHDYYSIWQSFSDPAISSDSDSDWSPKFGLGLGLGLKKLWLSYTLTQNYQSMKYLWRFNYSRYLCMWFIMGIIGF
jgi:hypothetical protein